jgi:hypothetical protein
MSSYNTPRSRHRTPRDAFHELQSLRQAYGSGSLGEGLPSTAASASQRQFKAQVQSVVDWQLNYTTSHAGDTKSHRRVGDSPGLWASSQTLCMCHCAQIMNLIDRASTSLQSSMLKMCSSCTLFVDSVGDCRSDPGYVKASKFFSGHW